MGPIFETWDLVYLLSGYHKHLVENAKPLSVIDMTSTADVVESVDGGKRKYRSCIFFTMHLHLSVYGVHL